MIKANIVINSFVRFALEITIIITNMSGGSLDYAYRNLESLAEEIGDRLSSNEIQFTDDVLSPEEKQIVLAEINALIDDLKSVAKRAKKMECWLSGDTGDRDYLEELK